MFNRQWSIDIVKAITDSFNTNKGDLKMFFEGVPSDKQSSGEWIEFRYNGPEFEQISKNDFKATVGVDILAQTDKTEEDIYSMPTLCGKVTELFDCIYVTSLNSTLQLDNVSGSDVDINHFGEIDESGTMRSSISGVYKIVFTIL
jgi:hypothetical protein